MKKKYAAKNISIDMVIESEKNTEDFKLQCNICKFKEDSNHCIIINEDVSYEAFKNVLHDKCPFELEES